MAQPNAKKRNPGETPSPGRFGNDENTLRDDDIQGVSSQRNPDSRGRQILEQKEQNSIGSKRNGKNSSSARRSES
jgi:hypothetical protein